MKIFVSPSDQQPPQHWMQYQLSSRNHPYNDDLHLQDQYQVSFYFSKNKFKFFDYFLFLFLNDFDSGSHGLL